MAKVKPPELAPADIFLYAHANGAITMVPASHRSQFVTLAGAIDAALGAHERGGVVFLGHDDAGLGRSAQRALDGLGVEIHPYDTEAPYLWENGTNALISAASLGRDAILDDLIGRGADIHARDDYGATALHHAAGAGNLHAIDALVARGADVHAITDKGFTPHALAVAFEHPAAANRLTELGTTRPRHAGADVSFHPKHHRVRFVWLAPVVLAVVGVPLLWFTSTVAAVALGAAAAGYLVVLPRSLWIGGAPRRLRGDTLVLKRLIGPEIEIDLGQVALAGFGGLERRRGRGPRWLLLVHPTGRGADRRELDRAAARRDEVDAFLAETDGIVLVDLDQYRRHEVILAVGERLAALEVAMLPSLQGQLAAARAEAEGGARS